MRVHDQVRMRIRDLSARAFAHDGMRSEVMDAVLGQVEPSNGSLVEGGLSASSLSKDALKRRSEGIDGEVLTALFIPFFGRKHPVRCRDRPLRSVQQMQLRPCISREGGSRNTRSLT